MAGRDLRLLCLDAGGFRGLSTLLILKRLMEAINSEDPPKPCDYFDMIGGSGTGGLIAILLGRLQLDVDSCIRLYTDAFDRVLGGTPKSGRPRLGDKFKARYESSELERAMRDCLVRLAGKRKGKDLPKDQPLLRDGNGLEVGCKVFVCATSKQSGESTLFTSYLQPSHSTSRSRPSRNVPSIDLFRRIRIYEAARATCATPTCFEPMPIGDPGHIEDFFDSARDANPIRHLLREATNTFLKPGETFGQRIGCLVSIGAGKPTATGRSSGGGSGGSSSGYSSNGSRNQAAAMRSQQRQQRDSESEDAAPREAERIATWFESENDDLLANGQFFRFSVDRGLERVSLEHALQKQPVLVATRNYLRQPLVKDMVDNCARGLEDCRRGFS